MPTIVVANGTNYATANSYCSLAEAATYHALVGTEWDATDSSLDQLLIQASYTLDLLYGERWASQRLYDSNLAWPRFAYVDNRYCTRPVGIPKELKRATAWLAQKMIDETFVRIPEPSTVSNVRQSTITAGDITTSMGYFEAKPSVQYDGFYELGLILAPLMQPLVKRKNHVSLVR